VMHRARSILGFTVLIGALFLAPSARADAEVSPANAESPDAESPDAAPSDAESPDVRPPDAQFRLVRVVYDSVGGYGEAYYVAYGRTWQRWETDYPEAEWNFARRLGQLTRLRVQPEPTSLAFDDPRIFEFPFLFMSDVGWMKLDAPQIARMREYLAKGGFVWVDDFWGDGEWNNFEEAMRKVLPGQRWRELPAEHPLRHIAFDIDQVPQIPAREFAMAGMTSEPPSYHRDPAVNLDGAHLRGYFDAEGRLMLIATHNTDVGDGFEREAYGQKYFEMHSTRAYALGVNIILYALTH